MKRKPAYERLAFEFAAVALAMVLNLGQGLQHAAARAIPAFGSVTATTAHHIAAPVQLSMLGRTAVR